MPISNLKMKTQQLTTNTRKKLPRSTSQTALLIFTKVLNLSKVPLNNNKISVLKLGLSFTLTLQNIPDLEYNLYQFSQKLRLTYHFRNSNFQDASLVKIPSSFTPPPNEHQELENICKQIEHTPINVRKSKDNLMNLRKGLELLLEKVNTNKIIIKPADKGSIIVVMAPKDYSNIC